MYENRLGVFLKKEKEKKSLVTTLEHYEWFEDISHELETNTQDSEVKILGKIRTKVAQKTKAEWAININIITTPL